MKQLLILLAMLIGLVGQTPAAALPPADSAPAMHAMHVNHHASGQHEGAPTTGQHGDGHQCLGCAASYATLPAAPLRRSVAGLVLRMAPMERMRGICASPATPPPRAA